MDKNNTELLMKLDYVNMDAVNKFISILETTNIKVTKIGTDEFSITIKG